MQLKILFVDDDENILASFRTMLHSMRREWKCYFVSSTKEALDMVAKDTFDVVIADMRMPSMDGADFLREVEKIQGGTVRIILSGYSEMQAQLKSTKSAHQFLTKPCNSETVIETIQRVAELRYILTDDSIRAVVSRLGALPSMPELIVQIRGELESPDPDLNRVAKLVEQDAGTSATILKVVNSTFFGFFEEITSPSRAVILLGVEILKGLVLGVNLLKELNVESLKGYSVEKLWDHSLQTGYLAKTIASFESDDEKFIDCCFVGGLLHDIGKLVLITKMDTLYAPIMEATHEEGGPIVDIEARVLGATHADIGAYLLGLWGFNGEVVKSVHCHHSLNTCSEELSPALVVHVADYLQHELAPQNSEYIFFPLSVCCLEGAGVCDRLEKWRAECSRYMEEGDECS